MGGRDIRREGQREPERNRGAKGGRDRGGRMGQRREGTEEGGWDRGGKGQKREAGSQEGTEEARREVKMKVDSKGSGSCTCSSGEK